MKFDVKKIAIMGVVAAAYVVLTISLGNLAYGGVQFRISEALMLLCFYRKEYCYALSVGCFISNMFSPMPIDMVVGTAATVIAAVAMYLIGKKAEGKRRFPLMIAASLVPAVANGIIVGIELFVLYGGIPLWLYMAQVAFGEFICVTVLGVIIFGLLEKNRMFMKLVCFSDEKKNA